MAINGNVRYICDVVEDSICVVIGATKGDVFQKDLIKRLLGKKWNNTGLIRPFFLSISLCHSAALLSHRMPQREIFFYKFCSILEEYVQQVKIQKPRRRGEFFLLYFQSK